MSQKPFPPILDGRFFRSIDALPGMLKGGVVAVGNFDGVHLGHALLVRRLKALAEQVDGPTLIFTFDPHPVALLRPDAAPVPLASTERNAELLLEMGVDGVLAYPTDRDLLDIEPRLFFDLILLEKLKARGIVEGSNFRFGRNRAGNVALMENWAEELLMPIEIVEPLQIDGQTISSTVIRKLIREGEVAEAAELLDRPHRINGFVVKDEQRGTQLGFPTANLTGVDTILPAEGIYAAWADTDDGRRFPAAVSIGPNPTFGQDREKVEAHLLDFFEDIYGRILQLDFIDRIRPMKRFDSVEDLVAQLHDDVEMVRRITKSAQK